MGKLENYQKDLSFFAKRVLLLLIGKLFFLKKDNRLKQN